MSLPVAPGVTPGSGPGHLALFGYDPLQYVIGRGALSALGVGFDLMPGDVAVRLNLATLDAEGRIQDRRAGRPTDAEGRRVVERLVSEVSLGDDVELFLIHEKEHRAVLVLRGSELEAAVRDTDPQQTGVPPLDPIAEDAGSERTAKLVARFLDRAHAVLSDESRVNGLLARGFARYDPFPSMEERFGLSAVAVARYPMYRGVARLVGMEVPGTPESDDEAVSLLESVFGRQGAFHFLHFKGPDARGEDGDYDAKVRSIEEADERLGRVMQLSPDVTVVTGDHSTPTPLAAHSWHHVPVLIASPWARPTAERFGEATCRAGELGLFEARHLMSLVLAHAGRLTKFGA